MSAPLPDKRRPRQIKRQGWEVRQDQTRRALQDTGRGQNQLWPQLHPQTREGAVVKEGRKRDGKRARGISAGSPKPTAIHCQKTSQTLVDQTFQTKLMWGTFAPECLAAEVFQVTSKERGLCSTSETLQLTWNIKCTWSQFFWRLLLRFSICTRERKLV